MLMRGFAALFVVVLLAGSALANGPELLDADYAYVKTGQRDSVQRHVRQLVAPTLTFPALVRLGGRFRIWVRVHSGPQLARLAADEVKSWAVDLHPTRPSEVENWPCKVLEVKLRGSVALLTVAAPVQLARDVYDLSVVGPGIDDRQPSAVRIYGLKDPERFRFAVITDNQLWDPTARIKGKRRGPGGFPRREGDKDNMAIARQALVELGLWDPDFTLHLGDLVFGVNYRDEYREAYDILRSAGLPLYAVPGNHDAYADYVVRLKDGALKALTGAVSCRKHIAGDLSWAKAWSFISCVYGDVKHLLYADLHRDGLIYWRRQLGPPDYAFDHGQLRFVGINTYAGTPERRHAFSIYMDVFDLHLGAPAVDNYGGYLTADQLAFVGRQARQAAAAGQTLVLFGHHDPRGNSEGRRYHPNQPFPTDPISLGGFEQWNFDSNKWDSDPRDARSEESETQNSGVALLKILARYGGYYLSGHVHHDAREIYEPGSKLPGGIAVKRRLEFITTTTATAGVRGDGYWGYRVIEVDGHRLRAIDYAPKQGLTSIPAGNLWLRRKDDNGSRGFELTSALPRPAAPVVRWELPARAEGYRFRIAASGSVSADPSQVTLPVVERVLLGPTSTTYWTRVQLPAAKQPASPSRLVQRRLRAVAARGNRPPQAAVEVNAAGGLDLQPLEAGFDVAPGQPLVLSAARSSDPDGDRIVSTLWDLGDGTAARGPRLVHRFSAVGEYTVRLTLVDEAGARTQLERTIKVQPPRVPGPQGCGCCSSGAGVASLAPPAMILLVLLGIRRWRQRVPRGNTADTADDDAARR